MRISVLRPLTVFAGAVAMVALLPEVAAACPVCFDARDENRQAFIATTAFMSLLPLGMVGGAGLWIRKRTQDRDQREGEALGQDGSDSLD